MSDEVIPRQVHAVAVSGNAGGVASEFQFTGKIAAKMIEKAMSDAVQYCYDHGITDTPTVREKMMLARENAKRALREMEQQAKLEAGVTPEGS